MILCRNRKCPNRGVDLVTKIDPQQWHKCCRHAYAKAPKAERWHYHAKVGTAKGDQAYTGAKGKCPLCHPKKSKGAK